MAYLFEVHDKTVIPTTEVLLISPFKDIWERDTSPKKERALQELSYIEFVASTKKTNPFKDYSDEVRPSIVKSTINLPEDWEEDDLIKQGIQGIIKYQTEASATYSMFVAAKTAYHKIESFFLTVDLNERNKMGIPIFKAQDVNRSIKELEGTLMSFTAVQKKVEEELFESTRVKADKVISVFADPKTLNKL